jgi:hypothetical protein
MKRSLFVLIGLLALLALVAIPAKTTQAGTGATCWSNPAEGPIGTVFSISCTGFSPSTHVWAYVVEPDGAAQAIGDVKTNENGSVAFGVGSKFGTFGAAAVGKWTIVVEQLGLAGSVVARGEGSVRVTGGTEGVSGAHVWTSADMYTKGQWVTIYGSGFAANEMVTLWWEYPNGDCSSFTYHDYPYYNSPAFRGYSSLWLWDVKADGSGSFATSFYFNPSACEGKYHFVARGNSSGLGGDAWASLTGHSVATNAWLSASKDMVVGISDTVSFSGSGYAAGESVSCWLRTPQNQVTAVVKSPEIKANSSGQFSFSIYTGSYFPPYMFNSEGALGVYAMTCRGNLSGATAIAEFTVTGGAVDP